MPNRRTTYTAGTDFDITNPSMSLGDIRGSLGLPFFLGAGIFSSRVEAAGVKSLHKARLAGAIPRAGFYREGGRVVHGTVRAASSRMGALAMADLKTEMAARAGVANLGETGLISGHFPGDPTMRGFELHSSARGMKMRGMADFKRTGLGGKKMTARSIFHAKLRYQRDIKLGMSRHVLDRTRGKVTPEMWRLAKQFGVQKQIGYVAVGKFASAAIGGLLYGPPALALGRGAIMRLGQLGEESRRTHFDSEFVDTQGSYTERQRALRAITSSRMSARAAIGGEAMLYHR